MCSSIVIRIHAQVDEEAAGNGHVIDADDFGQAFSEVTAGPILGGEGRVGEGEYPRARKLREKFHGCAR